MKWVLLPIPLVVVVVCWQTYILVVPDNEFFIGSPFGVAKELVSSISSGRYLIDFSVTALEAVFGFVSGCCLGTLVGLALWYFNGTRYFARPYVLVLGSIPVYALAPMLVFWFGSDFTSKVIIAFLSTFFVSVTQAFSGASIDNHDYLELFRGFQANKNQIFLRLIVPTSVIWVISGARLNISYAVLGAFIGELISSNKGLGNMIMVAEGLYNVNQIWAGILGMIFVAYLLNLMVKPLERWASTKKLT